MTTHPGLRRFARALSWVATVTALFVLLGSAGVDAYINQQFSNIRRTPQLCLSGCKGSPTETGATENFLLVGSDSRSGDNSTGVLAGLNDGNEGGQNSDTTMLVHLSADSAKVTVISFPRDLLVDMPSMVVPATGATIGGYKAKFNAAYSVGEAAGPTVGPALLVKQVENLTGLPVDHYIEIDFAGFVNMVNALGGIEICLSQDAYDPGIPGVTGGSGFHGTKGVHSIDGLTALAYVRQRDGLPDGDLDRIQRQQRFLSSIIRKVKSAGTLLDPFKLNDFLSAVTSAITLDPGTTKDDLLTLATQVKSLDPAHIAFYTVPISGPGGSATDPLGEYLNIDPVGAHAIFQAVHDDKDPSAVATPTPTPKASASAKASASPTPTTTPGPPLTVPPSQVALTVSNGSGADGRGAAVTSELTTLGFAATLGPDTVRTTTAATEIHYGSGRMESAQTLAAAVPGAVLVPDETGGAQQLTLIVGTSYTAAHSVTLGAQTPTPASTSAASSAPAPLASATPSAAASTSPPPKATFTAATANCGP